MTFVVLTAEFAHESNTFSRNPTGYQAFAERSLHRGAKALAERGDANTPLAGFNDVGRREGWEIIHTIS
ncbi:M81 family metallopeptidase, partial [Acinetobacter baumannii]